ncbi:unnamed protein product, partial [Heterosigma akashiwo]
ALSGPQSHGGDCWRGGPAPAVRRPAVQADGHLDTLHQQRQRPAQQALWLRRRDGPGLRARLHHRRRPRER